MKIKTEYEVPPGTFITDRMKETWVIDTAGNAWRITGFPNLVYTPDFASELEVRYGPFEVQPERHP